MSCSSAATFTPSISSGDMPGRGGERGGHRLHAPDVVVVRARRALDGLVARVDRARQRFDARQVQVRDLAQVVLVILDPPEVDPVAAVGQVERRGDEQHRPHVHRHHDADGEHRDAGADEAGRRRPEEALVPDGDDAARAARGPRRRRRASCCRGRRWPPRPPRDGRASERSTRTEKPPSHADTRPAAWIVMTSADTLKSVCRIDARPPRGDQALRRAARAGDEHRGVRPGQHQRHEVGEVRHRERRAAAGDRQVDLRERDGDRGDEQAEEQRRVREAGVGQAPDHDARGRRRRPRTRTGSATARQAA